LARPGRDRASLVVVLCATVACGCATPAAAQSTGGAQIPQVIPPTGGGTGFGQPGRRTVVVAPTALVGRVVRVRGRMPGARRRRVVLQRFDPRHGWRNLRRSRVHSSGLFVIGWRPDRSGRIALRVVLRQRVGAAAAAPVARVNVYRPAQATFFGPGLYGKKTYCGQTLSPVLLGVAHRTLACGTPVAILFAGREIIVPVVDRGPFNAGYDWDLTQGTADLLGFTASGAIGYVRIKEAAAPG
jgi:rare lipoprotein A